MTNKAGQRLNFIFPRPTVRRTGNSFYCKAFSLLDMRLHVDSVVHIQTAFTMTMEQNV